ncbi:MAG: flagellar biosynthetic protein FliR [Candidatus Hydrogenedentes bacterium]|nr:flagellar biosynthetic protein FliR [Candidatus Hydrogenedentota bacterium]
MIIEVEQFSVFLLVAIRFSGLIVSAPILGSGNFPVIGKIGLIGLSAMLVTPGVPALDTPIPSEPLAFALMAATELLIGLIIGLVMTLIFAAIQVGGQIMDMQSGFGMMNVFNPALETQFPIFGFFYFIIAVLYLLIIGGHRMMIRALAGTFETIPLGGLAPDENLMWVVTRWGSGMFFDALLIAAPVMAAMMLAYITMGLMGRVVPQIHLFVVGFPLTIATALFVVALSLDLYIRLLNGMFSDMFRNVSTLIRGLG